MKTSLSKPCTDPAPSRSRDRRSLSFWVMLAAAVWACGPSRAPAQGFAEKELRKGPLLVIRGSISPIYVKGSGAWMDRRERFIGETSKRLATLRPRLPVLYQLDRDFETAARERESLSVAELCGKKVCGVAHDGFDEDWQRADIRAMFSSTESLPAWFEEAFAVSILGSFHGQPVEDWAFDLNAAGLAGSVPIACEDIDARIAIPVNASLIQFLDPDHRLSADLAFARLQNLTAEDQRRWQASLVRTASPQAVVDRPLAGATFSIVNRIERSSISNGSHLELERLARLGFTAISLVPFAGQRGPAARSLRSFGSSPAGETDLSMRLPAERAHRLGMSVFLKPQIWIRPPSDSTHIDPGPEGWTEWFASYERFILHNALLARAMGAEWFSVGHELTEAQVRPEWRPLIEKIRKIYHGRLIYSANHYLVETVRFWDLLDAIGVSAYFPISDAHSPDSAQLAAGIGESIGKMDVIARQYRKNVILTELGFRSTAEPWIDPWEERRNAPVALADQARVYEAALGSWSRQPWFGGFFIWKYESDPAFLDPTGFTPKGKPAEKVISRFAVGIRNRERNRQKYRGMER